MISEKERAQLAYFEARDRARLRRLNRFTVGACAGILVFCGIFFWISAGRYLPYLFGGATALGRIVQEVGCGGGDAGGSALSTIFFQYTVQFTDTHGQTHTVTLADCLIPSGSESGIGATFPVRYMTANPSDAVAQQDIDNMPGYSFKVLLLAAILIGLTFLLRYFALTNNLSQRREYVG